MAQRLNKENFKKEAAIRLENIKKTHVSPQEINKITTRKLLRPFIVIAITSTLLFSFEVINRAVFVHKYSSQISSELDSLNIENITNEIKLKCDKKSLVINYQSSCFMFFEQKGLNYDATNELLISNNWKVVEQTSHPTSGGYGKSSSYTKNELKASIYANAPNNARLLITSNE